MSEHDQIEVAEIEDSHPLSPMQEGMLFHSLWGRDAGVDIEQILCDLDEPLNVAAFESAWQRILERHAILRTGFDWKEGGEPRQVVRRNGRLHPARKDWSGLGEGERRRRLEEVLRADRKRGFDPHVPPLMRLLMIRIGKARWWMVLSFHHLLLDGRALAVVLEEVFAIYEALTRGVEPSLEPPPPYRRYIDWLRTRDLERAELFWREYLEGFGSPTPLPAARSRHAPTGTLGPPGEAEVEISESVTNRLHQLAEAHDLTLNTVLQGAWSLLLAHYSGEEDVVFGAVRACRRIPVEGAERMAGLMINTVPVRVRIDRDAPLVTWLKELRVRWRSLRDFEHTPLAKVQSWSGVPRGEPLFETLFNYQQPSWMEALRALGGNWEGRRFQLRSRSNHPLVLDAYGGRPLLLRLIYDRRRIGEASVARLLGHLRTLLEEMVENPNQRVAELSGLTQEEKRLVLVEWNRTDQAYPGDRCVIDEIRERALSQGERLAVADEEARFTYDELNRRANQVAHRLKALGVGPEGVVGVCMERSARMIVAWLGVLKAGGAYLPLDPAHPKERLAYLLESAGISVVLSEGSLLEELPDPSPGVEVLCVDANWTNFSAESEEEPESGVTPDNLAYLIPTSGSTGSPKGVEVCHRSLMNLIHWHQRAYQVTPEDRASQLAGPSFDAAVWEVWPYLASGASVHPADEETRLDPARLIAWLAEHQITVGFLPTPLAEAVMRLPVPSDLALRMLLTGGERLTQWPAPDFPCLVVNHYGPTEGTVVATCAPVVRDGDDIQVPSIGRPIDNTRVYVLDQRQRPVPLGAPGELWIGGAGVARGYRGRPDLTEERFVPDFIGIDPGSRLYRTGDLARWRENGELEFLGRVDDQVKIRGHRVEPGEIASVLHRHPAVRQAVVIPRSGARGIRLVAYLTATMEGDAGAEELKRFLRRSLPDSMVPAAFVWLDTLPLTPNGKVDHGALPEPSFARKATTTTLRTAGERKLGRIWREVLGVGRVGRHDHFFELGGHSLLATQVIARIRSELSVSLPVREIFEHPTLTALASVVERNMEQGVSMSPVIPRRNVRKQAGRKAGSRGVRGRSPRGRLIGAKN